MSIKKQKHHKEIIKERKSIFDFSGEFSNLSLDEKKKTYLLLVKYLLTNNEINIKKIENNLLIGNYKKIDINVKCLFKQGCFMIMEDEIIKFEKEVNEEKVIGFLVSNVYFSDQAIKRVGNNDKIYLCHENELVNDIIIVEKFKCDNLKDIIKDKDLKSSDLETKNLIEELEFLISFQNSLIEHQEKSIKELKLRILF
ncbi:8038_t:CDS:2 [Scutellospora calospora]|uniref:8038_t:CDS:1 n=1 Tax=Scutellospora calospora TaxID=85575 RepID=A0ACA9KHS5_9GLOM|nr:8038_t:CDS:2 [Scutellospora calospora]